MSARTNDALEKLSTSDIAPGGLLNADQIGFLDEVQENSELLSRVRTLTVSREKTEINALGVGERIRDSHAEDSTGGGSASANVRTVDIDCEKSSVSWYLTSEMVRDNIEREQIAQRMLNRVTQQFAADTQDLAINGDEGGSGWVTANDGWLALATAQGMPTYDHQTDGTSPTPQYPDEDMVHEAITTLDDKYWSDDMVIIMSPQQVQQFAYEQTQRSTPLGDAFLSGSANANPFGFDLVGAANWPQDKAMFVNPDNLIYALYREMDVNVLQNSDEIQSKDLYAKYAMYTRDDFQIEDPNAGVLITGLKDPTA